MVSAVVNGVALRGLADRVVVGVATVTVSIFRFCVLALDAIGDDDVIRESARLEFATCVEAARSDFFLRKQIV